MVGRIFLIARWELKSGMDVPEPEKWEDQGFRLKGGSTYRNILQTVYAYFCLNGGHIIPGDTHTSACIESRTAGKLILHTAICLREMKGLISNQGNQSGIFESKHKQEKRKRKPRPSFISKLAKP